MQQELSVEGDCVLHGHVRRGDAFHLEETFRIDTTDCEQKNALSHTPLYVACEEGKVDCVKVLLSYGACLKYTHGSKKFSCLNAAIDANKREVVMAILSLPRKEWMDAFKFCSEDGTAQTRNIYAREEITPLRKLIKKMPEVARMVFDKLCQCEAAHDNYFYRIVTYDYELLEDYQDLYSEFYSQQEQSNQQQAELNNWGPKHYEHQTHPLYLMVRYKRKDLLGHELVTSFLCMRWNMFLKYLYYINLLSYIILMLLLTIYVHIYYLYAQNYAELTNQTLRNCSTDFNSEYPEDKLASQFPLMTILLITVSAVIVAICLFRIFTEVTQMISNPREYFTSLLNYVELFLYFSTISFVCNGDFMCLTGWRWQLGAICIFLSWLNFVFFLRLQPKFGIYVIMFEEIIATFLKVLPLAVLLILAFGQPFFILLGPIVIKSDPRTRPFSSLPYSLMKTLTMMIGEFENDPLLYGVPNVLLFPVSTYFVWIIFVIVMSVLLQNLLVGLAVDNIKGIRKQAEFKRQVAQVKVLLTLMSSRLINFKKLLSYCMKSKHREQPTKYTKTRGKLHPSLLGNLKHKFSSLVNFAWKPEDMPVLFPKKKKISEVEMKMLEKLDTLSRMIQQLSQKIDPTTK